MAKKLIFENEVGSKMFDLLFNSYHLVAKPTSREDHKVNNKILDAFESISEELDTPVLGFPPEESSPRNRMLKKCRQYVILEDHQFDFLIKSLASLTTFAWKSREIERMWEFIDGAEKGGVRTLVESEVVSPDA